MDLPGSKLTLSTDGNKNLPARVGITWWLLSVAALTALSETWAAKQQSYLWHSRERRLLPGKVVGSAFSQVPPAFPLSWHFSPSPDSLFSSSFLRPRPILQSASMPGVPPSFLCVLPEVASITWLGCFWSGGSGFFPSVKFPTSGHVARAGCPRTLPRFIWI